MEVRDDLIIGTGISMANFHFLKDALAFYKVPVYLESSVEEVRKYAVVIRHKDGGTEEVPAENVIVSMGYLAGNSFGAQPSNDLVAELSR